MFGEVSEVVSRMNKAVGHKYLLRIKTALLTIVYQRHQKAQGHPKWICCIQLISVRFDRGKLFRSVRTSSNIYLVKFQVFFLGETKL